MAVRCACCVSAGELSETMIWTVHAWISGALHVKGKQGKFHSTTRRRVCCHRFGRLLLGANFDAWPHSRCRCTRFSNAHRPLLLFSPNP